MHEPGEAVLNSQLQPELPQRSIWVPPRKAIDSELFAPDAWVAFLVSDVAGGKVESAEVPADSEMSTAWICRGQS